MKYAVKIILLIAFMFPVSINAMAKDNDSNEKLQLTKVCPINDQKPVSDEHNLASLAGLPSEIQQKIALYVVAQTESFIDELLKKIKKLPVVCLYK